MKNQKEVQLSEKQFNILVENIQQVNYLREYLQSLEKSQSDFIGLIAEFNNIDFKNAEINIEKKILIFE